jgi:hypothetical protein
MDPTKKLKFPNSIAANAPISVTYTTSRGTMSKTYFRTEKKNIFFVEKADSFEVFSYLVGCYFAYDSCYPSGSKGVLNLLDYCVIGNAIDNSDPSVISLKHAFDNQIDQLN